ncbi:MAG: phosphoribosylaminoimidazolesuccinocarboxamide synthase [Gammaproteobacteria bacterium]
MNDEETLFESRLSSLRRVGQGKVRDLYEVDEAHLLMVTTDRLSAFDVVLPDPIPGKGRVLNGLSRFWFERTQRIVPNHMRERSLDSLGLTAQERAQIEGRAMLVRRLRALPIEAVVRGYLAGSGWQEYQRTGSICGIALPAGYRQSERLPVPIFTPATKAAMGHHDENIGYAQTAALIGQRTAEQVRAIALEIYSEAADYAATRGIIIADTKLEFGLDDRGELVLIDEVLTPDSSRFWPADGYRIGTSPPSFDKQFVRDYLEASAWNKQAPAPRLPAEVIGRTAAKYREALARLVGTATGAG